MKKIAYIFPGQGSQHVGMGKDLYDNFPAARKIFDEACEVLGFDVAGLCFEGPAGELSSTSNSQPAILTASVASLRAMEETLPEIKPSAALGLSLGEYTALVAAGSISFADGLKLVRSRGLFMEDASRENPGTMASVIGLSDLEEICSASGATVANLNCPGQVVISGRKESIDKARALAEKKGAKKCIVLDVSGPFHSPLMDSASSMLEKELAAFKFAEPSVPVISNVNASEESDEDQIKENLVNQVNHKTLWEDSVRKTSGLGIGTYLEIGPGRVLKGLLRRIDPDLKVYNVATTKDIEELRHVIKG